MIYAENNALTVAVTDYKIILANLDIDRYTKIYRDMPIDNNYVKLSAKASIYFQQYMINHARLTGLKSLCLFISTLEYLWGLRDDVYQIPWTDSISIYLLMLFDRLNINNRYKLINTLGALESASDHSQIGHPALNIIRSLFSHRKALLDMIQAQMNSQDDIIAVTINLLGSLLCCHARCTPLAQFCDKNIDPKKKYFDVLLACYVPEADNTGLYVNALGSMQSIQIQRRNQVFHLVLKI